MNLSERNFEAVQKLLQTIYTGKTPVFANDSEKVAYYDARKYFNP